MKSSRLSAVELRQKTSIRLKAESFLRLAWRTVIAIALYALDSGFALLLPAPNPNLHRVLVIRLDGIGDFVLWSSSARRLREIYPSEKHHLTIVANKAWAELARACGWFDNVIALDVARFLSNPFYRYSSLRLLRSMGFGAVIHPNYTRNFYREDAIVRLSGAAERIGSAGEVSLGSNSEYSSTFFQKLSDNCYTRLIPVGPQSAMELERHATFMRGLGLADAKAELPRLPIFSRPSYPGLKGKEFYVLFPDASWAGRRWPAAQMSLLAERIWRKTGWLTVVCGANSTADDSLKNSVFPVYDLTGRTSLVELSDVIAVARLVVSNESSAAHIAAAHGVSCVTIVGGGNFGIFFPYRVDALQQESLPRVAVNRMDCFGCNWNCIYHIGRNRPAPCIDGVSIDAVWNEVLTSINIVKSFS